MRMIYNNNYRFFIRFVGISLSVLVLFTLTGCSCENKDIGNSSSSAISAGSSKTAGSSGDISAGNNQSGSSDMGIGDNSNSSNLSQEKPVPDAASLIGRWEYDLISSYDNSKWGCILNFSENGTFNAFAAPEQSGATDWFQGTFKVSNGHISYDGVISDVGANSGENVSGTFIAFLTKNDKLILRGDDTKNLSGFVAQNVEYTKVQSTSSE